MPTKLKKRNVRAVWGGVMLATLIGAGAAWSWRETVSTERASLARLRCSPSEQNTELVDPYRYIAHAGGAIDGHRYSNSRDGLQSSYRRGFKMMEADLVETRDQVLAAAHDWAHWQEFTGSKEAWPTLAQFLATPIFGNLHAWSFPEISAFFREHPDLILVTDKTANYRALLRDFPDPDRLLVEIFSWDDLARAREAGIRYPMPSFLWGAHAREEILEARKRFGVRFLAVPTGVVQARAELMHELSGMGFCIYAFSSNRRDFVDKHLARHDVFGIYTDFYSPAESGREPSFTCPANEGCQTY